MFSIEKNLMMRERETPMWSKRGTTTDAVLVVDVRDGNVLSLLVEEDGR